jgi:hypothetical protein
MGADSKRSMADVHKRVDAVGVGKEETGSVPLSVRDG